MVVLVFFVKQKTAYEMRISDWSSDVCSSDLSLLLEPFEGLSNTTIYDYFKADENAAGLYFYKHTPGVILPLAFLDPILADYRQGQIDAGYHSVYSSLGQGQKIGRAHV